MFFLSLYNIQKNEKIKKMKFVAVSNQSTYDFSVNENEKKRKSEKG